MRARAGAKRNHDSFAVVVVIVVVVLTNCFSPTSFLLSPRKHSFLSTIQMNVERLQKMAGTGRTGGKGTMRR